MSHFSPEDRLTIARRVAEMLALPHMVCHRRRCRRNGQCWYHFTASKQPCCLDNLNAKKRAIFEDLRADTEHVASQWGSLMLPHGTSSVTKEVRELAIDIVYRLVGTANRGRFTEWRRKRALEMAPRPAKPVPPPALPPMPAPRPVARQASDWPEPEFETVETTVPLIRVL